VHLVGFITKKFVTMHGHMNVKLMLMCTDILYDYSSGRTLYITVRRFGTTFPFFAVSKVFIVSVNSGIVAVLWRIPKPALRSFKHSRPPLGTHETARDPSKALSWNLT